jgi:hydrogenase nickel incorporation protein HypA/HybF
MHEFSIAQSIMQIVLAEAHKANARSVIKVTLNIGELAGVLPESLSFCFELLAKSTIAENAVLAINRIPIRALCSGCQITFQIADNRYLCPRCGKTTIELTSGRELQIAQLEVEDATD